MAKRAVIRISTDMLAKLMQLPEGMEVLHVGIGNFSMAFDLVVTAPDMADTDVEIGATPPFVHPLFELRDGVVRIVEVDYPRQQPTSGAE